MKHSQGPCDKRLLIKMVWKKWLILTQPYRIPQNRCSLNFSKNIKLLNRANPMNWHVLALTTLYLQVFWASCQCFNQTSACWEIFLQRLNIFKKHWSVSGSQGNSGQKAFVSSTCPFWASANLSSTCPILRFALAQNKLI